MKRELIVVLLPGLDGTGRLFSRLVDRAPRHLQPQVVSYPCDQALSYQELEVLVHEQLPADAPYIIVGESFSGPIAVSLASRPTTNLRGVVLAASFVTPPALRLWRHLPWRVAFRFQAPSLVLRQLLTASDEALLREVRDAVRLVSPPTLATRVRSALAVDVRRELAAVQCPVLYIQALRDLVVSPRCLREIASVRGDVAVQRVDTRHLVLQLEPDASWELIDGFASRVHAD